MYSTIVPKYNAKDCPTATGRDGYKWRNVHTAARCTYNVTEHSVKR